MSDKQKTINQDISISGIGLHTGSHINMTIKPAPENHWFVFKRIDLPEQPTIDANVDYVTTTQRGTTLEQNGAEINTTEHVLAALVGMGVDNALIEIDGPEIPILDGSAKQYVNAIEAVGIKEQDAEKNYLVIKENLTFEDAEKHVEMLIVPQDEFRLTVMVDYKSPLLGTQHASMYHMGEFKDEIASCRTFVFLREVEALFKAGLIKGGDVDNAIVMVDEEVSAERLQELQTLFNKPEIKIEGIGYLNNLELRFRNEPARHKLLDIVGDLALVGQPIKGHVLAGRPGHAANVAFAKVIKKYFKKDKRAIPTFDLNAEPVYNINDITKLLPHRPPFLLVDKIIELGKDHIVGVKNVTMNEDFFKGHFPGNPVMPGVLIVEAMAQTGGILTLSTVKNPEDYSTYFLKIDNVKFKKMVLPGDTLIFRLELIAPVRRGICQMKGSAYVRNKLVAEGELMAQIVKEEKKNEPVTSVHTS
ncbi:MAG: bifunctional UDP-3-O-[3-hydroxymyristoyl] N-acetylglucosamine deacetylase/3-hydroxyacyl-ACP dehydratase [Flavobacteriales bacterium]|nr:bifunctional UDP-3-O-[3-hydroxymyristoyl] N-acetylglucosamine deacetylase/3-hydroxyacyl-ACP dehydratase [Flavobacteriales bacterium]